MNTQEQDFLHFRYTLTLIFLLCSTERVRRRRVPGEKKDKVFVPWAKGGTMATAGRTKINTNIEKGHFGPVPGIEVGQRWQYRIQLSELGVHAPPGKK